jgi:hypothetical protein
MRSLIPPEVYPRGLACADRLFTPAATGNQTAIRVTRLPRLGTQLKHYSAFEFEG